MSTSSGYGEAQTRQRILEAAWDALQEIGAHMRLADVADRAGVSRQAIYLHFGDRPGLFIALVEFIDNTLDSDERIAHVLGAPTGAEALARLVTALGAFTERIDPVARALETGRDQDAALAAAWADRMKGRRQVIHSIVERIELEGALAQDWTIDTAADLVHALTSPRTWNLFVRELGWNSQRYTAEVNMLLQRALLDSG